MPSRAARIAALLCAAASLHLSAAFAIPNDGKNVNTPLVLGTDGKLSGTTMAGGDNDNGIVFRLNRDGTNYEVLHRFQGGTEGAKPEGGLVQGADGDFYGTTDRGGGASNYGTIYKVSPTGAFTTIYRFSNGTDGRRSTGTLARSGNNFIGTTLEGGANGYGVVFEVTPSGFFAPLAVLGGSSGAYSYHGMTRHSDGKYYGLTFSGGQYGNGTIFMVPPSGGGSLSVLHSFPGGAAGGGYALSRLIEASDTHKYGMTTRFVEGSNTSFSRGSIFRLTANGVQTLYSFTGNGSDGGYARGDLLEAARDNAADVTTFLGVTQYGGANNAGTIFRINVPGSVSAGPQPITTLHHFSPTVTGSYPRGGLISGGDGYFYGTTTAGGKGAGGTIYRLQMGADAASSSVTVVHEFPTPPDNDAFANAVLITGAQGSIAGTNDGATEEPGEPNHAGYPTGRSVWYNWTAPSTGTFAFEITYLAGNPLLGFYTGSAVNALTPASEGGFGPVLLRATAGTTYRIAVDVYSGGGIPFTLKWESVVSPSNDDFVNAQVLGPSGNTAGSNVNATREPGEPYHAGGTANHSVWYSWTAPETRVFAFRTTDEDGLYPEIAVYTGSPLNALTPVASAFAGDDGSTRVTVRATAGTVYKVAVDSYSMGAFVLDWQAASSPPNDDFVNAQLVEGSSGTVTGTNVDATAEPGEPSHYFNPALATIWYKWTAPQNGRAFFDASASAYPDVLLGVYRGSSVDHLGGLVSGGYPALGAFDAVAGVTYFIAVDNYGTSGQVSLSWRMGPPSGSTYEPYTFTTLAGNPPGRTDGNGANARFAYPRAVVVDADGNTYVADTTNNTIRKMTPAGVVSTFAGLAGERGTADGTGSAARFNAPTGLAIDTAGNLYVADSNNHTIRKITPAAEVSTVAGNAGLYGNGDGSGAGAYFSLPVGLALDSANNIYVADQNNQTIRKISPGGQVTTLAGLPGALGGSDGTGTAARFSFPSGVTADSAGNVFVADYSNNAIRKVTPAGEVTTFAGVVGSSGSGSTDGTGAAARFLLPQGITIDGSDNLYVADSGNHTIRKITPAAVVTTIAGTAGATGSLDGTGPAARFDLPTGVAVASSGEIVVADNANHQIRRVTSSGAVTTVAGAASRGSTDGTGAGARFNTARGIAVDSAGNSYLADTANHTIRKITPAGVSSTLAGLAGTFGNTDGTGSAARFRGPRAVAVDGSGNVFVADTDNHRIRKITPAGVVTTFAGSTSGSVDGTGTAARFNSPGALAFDPAGNLFVAATNSHTIRKITPGAVVTTFAGLAGTRGSVDGSGNAARFYLPRGIATDSAGNVFVADTSNHLVRKITPAGAVSTIAGSPEFTGSSDGAGPDARFYFPASLAVDGSGNIYVADRSNALIRKIAPNGIVSTLAGKVESPGFAEGAGAAARLNFPSGIAVSSAGRIYVADTSNNVIRVGALPLELTSAVSRKSHGTMGNFDRILPLTGTPGVEGRSVAGGNHTLVFTFTNDLVSGNASVTAGSGSVSGAPVVSGKTMTVNLTGVANQQVVTISLQNVTDVTSQVLPDRSFSVAFLFGDTNGDGTVNVGDAQQTRTRSGQDTNATNFRSDVNVDGLVNSGDAFVVRSRSGNSLPNAASP